MLSNLLTFYVFFIFFQKTDCKWGVSKEYKEKKRLVLQPKSQTHKEYNQKSKVVQTFLAANKPNIPFKNPILIV